MKLLTTNFLTCAVKACKTSPQSFPLHFRDATLERSEIAFNKLFMTNVLPRVNWDALRSVTHELGLSAMMPDTNPVDEPGWFDVGNESVDESPSQSPSQSQQGQEEEQEDHHTKMNIERSSSSQTDKDEILRKLHTLLLETGVVEGKLVCGNCGFEYPIKDGVGNFLLPPHLV